MMRKFLPLSMAVLCAIGLAGCSSATPGNDSGLTSPVAVAPVEETSAPSIEPTVDEEPEVGETAPGIEADGGSEAGYPYGKLLGTDNISIESTDGYTAELEFIWHERTRVEVADLSPGCFDRVNRLRALDNRVDEATNSVFAISVEVSADFPVVAGWQWPEDRYVNVSTPTGNSTTVDSHVCFELDDPGLGQATNKVFLNPSKTREIMTFIEVGQKNPKNPDGKLGMLWNPRLHVGSSGGYVKCVSSSIKDDEAPQCNSFYPR